MAKNSRPLSAAELAFLGVKTQEEALAQVAGLDASKVKSDALEVLLSYEAAIGVAVQAAMDTIQGNQGDRYSSLIEFYGKSRVELGRGAELDAEHVLTLFLLSVFREAEAWTRVAELEDRQEASVRIVSAVQDGNSRSVRPE